MHIDQQTFPVFARDYQAKVEALYAAQDADRESAYNAVIQSCSNCHQSHCPGPLMKIDKMSIQASK
jgi:cytochrome c556